MTIKVSPDIRYDVLRKSLYMGVTVMPPCVQ